MVAAVIDPRVVDTESGRAEDDNCAESHGGDLRLRQSGNANGPTRETPTAPDASSVRCNLWKSVLGHSHVMASRSRRHTPCLQCQTARMACPVEQTDVDDVEDEAECSGHEDEG